MNNKINIAISGMHCASCSANIERTLKKTQGVEKIGVNLASETGVVEYDPDVISESKIFGIIEKLGYEAKPNSVLAENSISEKKDQKLKSFKSRFLYSFIFGLPVIYLVMGPMLGLTIPKLFDDKSVLLQLLFTSLVIIFSWSTWKSGAKSLISLRPGMDALVFLGTATAYLYSLILILLTLTSKSAMPEIYFESAVFILIFISLGKYLEALTKGKTSDAIKKIMGLGAKEAIVIRNGKEIKVPIEEVVVGDIIFVKPGGKIPVDGIIVEGYSGVDEQAVTGESIPHEVKVGDSVIGATINKTGSLKIKATRVGKDTVLSQIIKIVEEATNSKAPIQELADTVSYYFTPTVISIAIISLIVWLLIGHPFSFALTVFVSVLIIACPCAMGLATPTAVMMGTGLAAKKGILVKSSKALEMARKIDMVVFDKTGTLTIGKPKVTDIVPIKKHFDKKYLLQIASSVEKHSEHPLAEAIVLLAKEKNILPIEISDFKAIPGKGVMAKFVAVGNKEKSLVSIGTSKIMNDVLAKDIQLRIDQLQKDGKTTMIVSIDNEIVGLIALADVLKSSTKQAIASLKKLKLEVAMLTGDNKTVGLAIAKEAGITNVFAEILPNQKAAIIKYLQTGQFENLEIEKLIENCKLKIENSTRRVVAMVGDGINDSPALAQADLGIAMGAGTDIAMETGDIILMKNDLTDVAEAIRLSRYTIKKVKQNLFWAFVYNVVGIPIAAGILFPFTGWLLSPSIAAAAMAMSSVSVVSNSLLMKRYQ